MRFPQHSSLEPVNTPPLGPALRTYFLRLTIPDNLGEMANVSEDFEGRYGRGVPHWEPIARPPGDQVVELLRPLDPHRFDIGQPRDFQKTLAALIADWKDR
jgi:hypothetical protein